MSFSASRPSEYHCRNHPDREGVGICVSCRSVVCVECATKIDRMNYCIRCLEAAGGTGEEEREAGGSLLAAVPVLMIAFLLTAGLFAALGILLATFRTGGGVSAG